MCKFTRANITQELLKSLFDYDSEAGRLIWKSSNRGRKAGQVAGTLQKCKKRGEAYRQITISMHGTEIITAEHRLVFLWHHGFLPKQLDHINMNKSDNRIENLRPSTPSTNQMNITVRKHTKSGLKGVHWDESRKKWMSRIKINGKHIFLGRFETKEDAHEARKHAQHIHGEFARM